LIGTEIKLPDYWSPDQAIEVFEFIDAIRDAILRQYQLQIIEHIRYERDCTESEAIDMAERREIPF
jgi:hypothetical protein